MEALEPFGRFIHRYEGHGALRLTGRHQRAVSFEVRQMPNGQLVLACQSSRWMDMFDARRLKGVTTDGLLIDVRDLQPILSRVSSDGMSHGVSYARSATCTRGIGGLLLRPYLNFSLASLVLPRWTLNESRLRFKTAGFRFSIRPVENYREIARQLERGSGDAITAVCRTRRDDQQPLTPDDAIRAVNDLCVALSLSIGSKVNWIVAEDEGWYRRHESRITKGYSNWINALDWTLSPQRSLTAWRGNSNQDYFRRMIEYFIDAAGRGPYIETRTLAAASLLDAVTGHYSQSVGRDMLVDDSAWRAIQPSIVESIDQITRGARVSETLSFGVEGLRRRSFRRRLRDLFVTHSLPTRRLNEIVEIRNHIVHYGRFPPNMKPADAYELVLWASFTVLARLVGYQGPLPEVPS